MRVNMQSLLGGIKNTLFDIRKVLIYGIGAKRLADTIHDEADLLELTHTGILTHPICDLTYKDIEYPINPWLHS